MTSNVTDTVLANISIAMDPRFEPVRDELAAVETLLRQAPEERNELLNAATARLFAAGGKRLRPAITLLSAGITEANRERAIYVAASIEMMHTATLVHDDLIDEAQLRRGTPTLNSLSSPATTVLVGDYLFARAAGMAAQAQDIEIMNRFAHTLMVILNGEIAQSLSRWVIDREEYEQRIYAKTAALFVLASQSAAILGLSEPEVSNALIEFGRTTGMAFQIVDDVLDYRGDEQVTGKPVGSDLRQGLFTLPAILYSENHPQDPHLELLLSGNDRGAETVRALIDSVRASGAIEGALNEARHYAARAQRFIERLPQSPYTAALYAIANAVIERTY